MVTLGTEWGRDNIHADLWARLWSARIATLGREANIVTDDVRFPNEVRALRHHGGELWSAFSAPGSCPAATKANNWTPRPIGP
jgi:hypothetical protein